MYSSLTLKYQEGEHKLEWFCLLHIRPEDLWNMGYPPETNHKSKSRKISCPYDLCLRWPIILEFCTEHDSITGVRCAKFVNDSTFEAHVMDTIFR